MNKLYVIVENGTVTNEIVWNGNTDVGTGGWQPPVNAELVEIQPQPQIGWTATKDANGNWIFAAP